jgi:xanthine/CO dehydrogenase XdhC/CoxF family maturation factor
MLSAARGGSERRIAFVTASRDPQLPLGLAFPADAAALDGIAPDKLQALRAVVAAAATHSLTGLRQPAVDLFVTAIVPPPRILLLGAGPDARPVAELANFLGWAVTAVDHRPGYLAPERFAPGTQLVEARAAEVAHTVRLDDHAAAIVMSHHLESDLQYLRALACSTVPYVGLLGPAARREKLLADLGDDAGKLRARLRAPVGLDIGGRAPESIALTIVGEIHAALAGRGGRPFSEVAATQ